MEINANRMDFLMTHLKAGERISLAEEKVQ
jgi:hypothetical protein